MLATVCLEGRFFTLDASFRASTNEFVGNLRFSSFDDFIEEEKVCRLACTYTLLGRVHFHRQGTDD
jgi:hypothetical protein